MNEDPPLVHLDATAVRTIGRDFRDVATRLLNSNQHEVDANLARLLSFIRANSAIWEFVQDCLAEHPVGERFEQTHRGRFVLPHDRSAEVAFTFALLSATSQSQRGVLDVAFHYDTSSLNAGVAAFLRDVAAPFVTHITRRLEDVLRTVEGYQGDTTRLHVAPGAVFVGGNIQGGIVATGNATVSGNVAAFVQPTELKSRLESLQALSHELAESDRASFLTALDRLSRSVDSLVASKSELLSDIEVVASRSEKAKAVLREIAVGAAGNLAAHAVVQATRFFFGF